MGCWICISYPMHILYLVFTEFGHAHIYAYMSQDLGIPKFFHYELRGFTIYKDSHLGATNKLSITKHFVEKDFD
jgi:hypothetical protein